MWRKRVFLVSAVILYFGVVFAYAEERVVIAITTPAVDYLTVAVAKERGFFAQEGLKTEIVQMRSATTIVALANHEVDYTLAVGSAVRAIVKGVPLRVVAGFLDKPMFALVARPDLSSVESLRGKTLGISSFGALVDVIGRKILEHHRIDEKEVKFVALGDDLARLAALRAGLVDAVILAPPADSLAQQVGFRVVLNTRDLFSFLFVGLATHVETLTKKPDQVRKVIRAMLHANRYIRDNRIGAIEVIRKFTGADEKNSIIAYDLMRFAFNPNGSLRGLSPLIDQVKKELALNQDIPYTAIADDTALNDLQKEFRD